MNNKALIKDNNIYSFVKAQEAKKMNSIPKESYLDLEFIYKLENHTQWLKDILILEEQAKNSSKLNGNDLKYKKRVKLKYNDLVLISRKELETMRIKLKNSIPVPAIVYMCGTTMAFTAFITLLLLQIFAGIFIIHPYFIFTGIIGSIGLFLTALVSLKTWKDFLTNE